MLCLQNTIGIYSPTTLLNEAMKCQLAILDKSDREFQFTFSSCDHSESMLHSLQVRIHFYIVKNFAIYAVKFRY